MMTIKNGKFFKDGVQVPIEHGNKEQIELLDTIREWTEEGFTPEMAVVKKLHMQFTCICGQFVAFDDLPEMDEDDMIQNIVDGAKDKCNSCGMEYKVIISDDEFLQLKMIPKKA